MPEHSVQPGECISSIAFDYGFDWETIWNHPDNAALAAQRRDPNILLPGDIVFIPEKTPRDESGQCEQRHRFRVHGTPCVLRIRLLRAGQPRGNLDYLLDIEGHLSEGKTSASGLIEAPVPSNAREGKITLLCDGGNEEYLLNIGSLNPIDEKSGAASRLHNLGYDVDPIEDANQTDARFSGALRAFQKDQKIAPTGELNEPTCARLKEIYGA